MAYRLHLDTRRGRWYLTASWQRPVVETIPLETARARGMVGVDTNADHFAAWRLDRHGNPVGEPRRFCYDLSGTAEHRDAQIRHALTRLLHWAKRCGVHAIGIEDLDFTAGEDPRETRPTQAVPPVDLRHPHREAQGPARVHGRRTRPGDRGRRPGLHLPVGRTALAQAHGHALAAPSPVTMPRASRSDDAPSDTRSGDGRHRPVTTRAIVTGIGPSRPDRGGRGREGTRRPVTERAHDARTRTGRTRKERGRPAHPKPFGMRAVPGSGSKTHS